MTGGLSKRDDSTHGRYSGRDIQFYIAGRVTKINYSAWQVERDKERLRYTAGKVTKRDYSSWQVE